MFQVNFHFFNFFSGFKLLDISYKLVEVKLKTGLETEASTSFAKLTNPLNPAKADIRSWLKSQNGTPSFNEMYFSLAPDMSRFGRYFFE